MNKRIKRKRNKIMSMLHLKGLSMKESRYRVTRWCVKCEYKDLSTLLKEPKYNKTNLRRALPYVHERFGIREVWIC